MTYKIPESHIDSIMEESEYEVYDCFGCCTVVVMRMPNGYVIIESSGCIDPSEYDHDLGVELCKQALKRKVWQLEGYLGKQSFFEATD